MSTNVHVFTNNPFEEIKILLLSDIHWDNPKCNRELLKKHLNIALEQKMRILINGDTICGMTGKNDRRGTKETLRKEFARNDHWNSICEGAIEFFKPYAHLIEVIGYGNHETAITRHLEIDVLKFIVAGLNTQENVNVQLGGYGGWVIYGFQRDNGHGRACYRIKYYHGTGGGGPVSRGSIQFNRMKAMIENADMIWSGHVHEDMEMTYTVERISANHKVYLKNVTMVRTSTYKEEYNEGIAGWHVERGAPPKYLGGRILTLKPERHFNHGKEEVRVVAQTQKII